MPTDKQRVSIVVDDELLMRMNEYQRNRGLSSMSKTASELIMKGLLAQDESLHNGQVYSGQEIQLIRAFKCADEDDKQIILTAVVRALAQARKRRRVFTATEEYEVESIAIDEIGSLISLYGQADSDTRREALEVLLGIDNDVSEDQLRSAIQSQLRSSQGNQQSG